MTSQLGESRNQKAPIFDDSSDMVGTVVTGVYDDAAPPVQHTGRQGFLPIRTNTFDRVFISVVCFVAIHLLWMRLIEAFIPLLVATVLSLVLAVNIVRKG